MWRSLHALRVCVAVIMVALVAACSFSRFAYNQADTAAAWMIDDYFTLEGDQKQDFQKRFERVYAWHRAEQLPEYAAFLRTARGRVQQGLKSEDVLWFVDGVRSRVRVAARYAAPDTAAFLATITPAQIENLKAKWEKDNAKYVRENKVNGTPDERIEVEAKKVSKAFKEWLTGLNNEQEQRVMTLVRDLPPIYQFRYTERLRRQKEFIALLAHRAEERERFTARVSEWLANWDRGRSAEDQKRLDAWWAKRAEIFAALEKSLTGEQRTASLARMQRYIDDATQLASREGARSTAAR
ncbi:MAG: DUF6279 family lipoprotein [Pseudomonadota bacterium]